ncbi:MAG: M20/M25/M40 family metallo-hydrolase [Ignavibacteriae bacterium]|nr:M20/M25/M40 family metallo-hydrolase [Ignavibacteriota bacterium]
MIFTLNCCDNLRQNSIIPGLESINQNDLMKNVDYFTGEELDGRLSGSSGYYKAAEYAKEKFKSLRLEPAFGDKYFQPLFVEYNEIKSASLTLFNSKSDIKIFELGEDFVCRGFSGSGNFTADAAFCGYGLSEPGLGYDDYKNIDVSGKIVIVFKQNPKWKINNLNWKQITPRQKSAIAAEHGARGILFVSRPNDKNPQGIIGSVYSGEGEQNVNFPQLHISKETANDFLEKTGAAISEYQTKIDSLKTPHSILLNNKAAIKVEAEYNKRKETVNIAAMLKGSYPVMKNEYVVVGAHLDHVGRQGEIYFPGANDNASGSSALLEIAEAFVVGEIEPKRSIIFVLFASEEAGLFGSKYFVNTFPQPLNAITAMLNLDCIGYGDSIQVHNGKGAPELWNLAKQIDEVYTKSMISKTWGGGGADATPFHERGIPSIYFVSTNSYDHLHSISDKPETLNRELIEKITRLAYLTVYETAIGNYSREEVNN